VFAPILWFIGIKAVAVLLGLQWDWKVTILCVFVSFWGDFLDAVIEKRPVMGPERWR
jgi:hypothetical protein